MQKWPQITPSEISSSLYGSCLAFTILTGPSNSLQILCCFFMPSFHELNTPINFHSIPSLLKYGNTNIQYQQIQSSIPLSTDSHDRQRKGWKIQSKGHLKIWLTDLYILLCCSMKKELLSRSFPGGYRRSIQIKRNDNRPHSKGSCVCNVCLNQ